jgi:hypothetical protein
MRGIRPVSGRIGLTIMKRLRPPKPLSLLSVLRPGC